MSALNEMLYIELSVRSLPNNHKIYYLASNFLWFMAVLIVAIGVIDPHFTCTFVRKRKSLKGWAFQAENIQRKYTLSLRA